MAIFLTLAGVISLALLADWLKNRGRTVATPAKPLARFQSATKMIPHALTMLIMVSHASEITRVVSHISLAHGLTALGVFVLWVVTNTGSEEL